MEQKQQEQEAADISSSSESESSASESSSESESSGKEQLYYRTMLKKNQAILYEPHEVKNAPLGAVECGDSKGPGHTAWMHSLIRALSANRIFEFYRMYEWRAKA